MTTKIQIFRLPYGLPMQMPNAHSLDLLAAVNSDDPTVIASGHRAAIPTGLVIAVPPGTVGLICPRSGPALRLGIGVMNSIVDHDYRGEVLVILQNHGTWPYTVERGTPIARFIITPVLPLLDYEMVDHFEDDDTATATPEQQPIAPAAAHNGGSAQQGDWP